MIDELLLSAVQTGDARLAGTKGSGNREVDLDVDNKTLEELSDKWLSGPIALNDLPAEAVVNRRFGIRQGAKIRLIDDFSGSGVNSYPQTSASPFLHTLDFVAAVLRKLNGLDCKRKWLGKTFDLAAANSAKWQ